LLMVGHCNNQQCGLHAAHALMNKHIPFIPCQQLAGRKLGELKKLGKRPGGGIVVATQDSCVEVNYEQAKENSCHEIDDACYEEGGADQLERLQKYILDTTSSGHKTDKPLWNTQAHWQYNSDSVTRGLMRGSCLLQDNSKSKVNEEVLKNIKNGTYKHINIIGMDNVCEHGKDITAALEKLVASRPEFQKKFSKRFIFGLDLGAGPQWRTSVAVLPCLALSLVAAAFVRSLHSSSSRRFRFDNRDGFLTVGEQPPDAELLQNIE